MGAVVAALADFLIDNVEGVDSAAIAANADTVVASLTALDQDLQDMFDTIPEDQRVLVTNHEVFAYFAEQYDFEVIGAVISGFSTDDGVDPRSLAELAETVADAGVPAIFSDASASDELAVALASEVGDIAIVELFTESLGASDSEGATYEDMMRTNASRITSALGG